VERKMKHYTVSIYLTVEADNEGEARDIAYNLEIKPAKDKHIDQIFWNSQNTEVEEEVIV